MNLVILGKIIVSGSLKNGKRSDLQNFGEVKWIIYDLLSRKIEFYNKEELRW